MRFGIMFANTGHGASPAGATAVAEAAERGGFDTIWTVEHVVVPSGYESPYPYDPSGKMAGGAEHFDLPDPLIWLTWAAAKNSSNPGPIWARSNSSNNRPSASVIATR
jgi:alkanesulfonate monooxygenase SsuD/methylene tetrahydromethanopterin reductase-like flavin-dependent oxidoreductase (luciferase family)